MGIVIRLWSFSVTSWLVMIGTILNNINKFLHYLRKGTTERTIRWMRNNKIRKRFTWFGSFKNETCPSLKTLQFQALQIQINIIWEFPPIQCNCVFSIAWGKKMNFTINYSAWRRSSSTDELNSSRLSLICNSASVLFVIVIVTAK